MEKYFDKNLTRSFNRTVRLAVYYNLFCDGTVRLIEIFWENLDQVV